MTPAMPLAERGGACGLREVLLDEKGFVVRVDEVRELGRNPIKDMSV